ncbi:hypothetical protein PISMIDRAFT_18739 [Pisolithus microcarpus 441]|uniref:Uncharacterized protein n=1 Tax=Pisolithus microcarpus 441 TaxID=765257 RepID=A0A0C9Y662_9AGAM|nr:hypothetical protein PISMIDRAFT_18739 [Pisolithus microcarpus 441]
MPAVVTTLDDDENFDIDNVSPSSNEDDQMLDRQVCSVPSNDMDRPITPDPLLNMTGSGGRTASTFDVNYFFDRRTNSPSRAMCSDLRNRNPAEFDNKYLSCMIQYSKNTATSMLCLHIEKLHLLNYLDLALQKDRDWPIQVKVMKDCITNGYSLQELKSLVDRGVSLKNLPPHPVIPTPNPSSGDTNDDHRSSTPPFSITIFHKSLVNFIIADDQSLQVVKCKEFRLLLLLLNTSGNPFP